MSSRVKVRGSRPRFCSGDHNDAAASAGMWRKPGITSVLFSDCGRSAFVDSLALIPNLTSVRITGRLLTIAALCFAVGLHWLALQSIAWTTMVVEYSKKVSLTEAVAQTFDGEHPCGLCHAVQKGKNSERKNDFSAPTRLDLYCAPRASARVHEYLDLKFEQVVASATARFDSPPTPPPRSGLA